MFVENIRKLNYPVKSLNEDFTGKMLEGQWRDVELRPNKLWVIISPLTWIRPNNTRIDITPHLITDYASIPQIFWWLLPKRSIHYDVAALFHDDCVRHHKLRKMSLLDCHNIFKEIMKHYKTPKWQYEAMYGAVIIGGPFLRTDGYGSSKHIKLTQEEIEKYNLIKQHYPWQNDDANTKYHKLCRDSFLYAENA